MNSATTLLASYVTAQCTTKLIPVAIACSSHINVGKFWVWITVSLRNIWQTSKAELFIRRLEPTAEKYSADIRLHPQKPDAAATAAATEDLNLNIKRIKLL